MHLDDYVEFAKLIEDKVDLINVSCGSHEVERLFVRTHPSMFLEHGCNVYLAEAVKKAVKVPVSCVGGLNDPAQMEEIIASGKADIVELGRALLADPELPKKTFSGREDEIRPCLRCFECLGHSVESMGTKCSVNPIVGNELSEFRYVPPTPSRKVLVIGGGPGGMMAAQTLRANGNNVYLASEVEEKGADQLGDEIVILGGGLVGCETAIHLGKLGKKVTVVEMRSEAAADCNCFHKIAIGMELKKYVTVLTDTKAENITDKGLEGLDKDGNKIFVPADAVICAAGMRSDTTVADMVQKMEIEIRIVLIFWPVIKQKKNRKSYKFCLL